MIKILHIDDHPLIVTYFKELLSIVLSKSDFELMDAGKLDKNLSQKIDSASHIICDIDINGSNIFSYLKNYDLSDKKVVILSGLEQSIYPEEAKKLGLTHFIPKSLPYDSLVKEISSFFSDEKIDNISQYFSEETTSQFTHQQILTLSKTENNIADLISKGESNKEITRHLDISYKTFESFIDRIKKKLSAESSTELRKQLINYRATHFLSEIENS